MEYLCILEFKDKSKTKEYVKDKGKFLKFLSEYPLINQVISIKFFEDYEK